MITDAQLTFASNQAITADAASANQVDLTTARMLGRTGAQTLRLIGLVTTAFNNLTSIQCLVRQSDAANMASPDTIYTSPSVLLANLTAGAVLFDIPWPGIAPLAAKRYMDIYFDITGTAPSAGAVWAGVVMNTEGGELRLGTTGLS